MTFTTPRTWQVGDEVTAALLNGISGQISQLQAALTPSANIPITINSPYAGSGSPYLVVIGGVAHFLNGISNANITAATTIYGGVMQIPSGYWPGYTRYIPAGSSFGGQTGTWVINTNGSIDLRTGSAVGSYYRLESVTYPIGL